MAGPTSFLAPAALRDGAPGRFREGTEPPRGAAPLTVRAASRRRTCRTGAGREAPPLPRGAPAKAQALRGATGKTRRCPAAAGRSTAAPAPARGAALEPGPTPAPRRLPC